MSARDKLIRLAEPASELPVITPDETVYRTAEEIADEILAEHAKELADKQWAEVESWPDAPANIQFLLKQGAGFAIDVIQPEEDE